MPDARPFTHCESGTAEPTWLLDSRWDGVPRFGLDASSSGIHMSCWWHRTPTMRRWALGGALADLADSAATVTVVIATHGGHGPGSTERRIEAERAISTLGPHIKTVWWNLPDGNLPNAVSEMGEQLLELVDSQTLLIAPVECDGHSDHEAVAAAAEAVARERDAAWCITRSGSGTGPRPTTSTGLGYVRSLHRYGP